MKKGMIKATDAFERVVHWSLALSCILLFVTGLGMMFHSFNFIGNVMGGLRSLKYVHNFGGLVFAVSLVLAVRMWWHEAGKFEMPEDLEWMKAAGGYLWHVDNMPEVGKYNPGQKAFFLAVAVFGAVMVFTGLLMWFQPLSPGLLILMYPLHALGFVVLFAFFFVHLYLGTVGSPGSAPAMFSGWVTRAWAKKQHPKWLRETEESGSLEVYGEEKKEAHSAH
ncbi:MAG: formate dehydrogenase subunit gamma [Syntrophales bacterium]|nr:formate dehydrogenase subunit gamma [Syntrophales bacterium]MDD5231982.1 formate dehydrogenase subunit gamma [Syntrophales bacterium]MDD5531845.1 formate dehydrogenase subunit gamma [Syntrophales bacterium]HPL64134.1 formate dehydrogenase subunit gamma [Syntrophales bacterium]